MAKKQKVKEAVPSAKIDKNFIDTYYTKENIVPSDLYKKDENVREELKSLEYKIFKEKNPTNFSKIINFGANTIGKVIKFNINKDQEKKINTLLYLLGYDFDAKQLYGFGIFMLVALMLLGVILLVLGQIIAGLVLMFLGVISFIGVQIFPQQQMTVRLSKSSSDLVTMILYMVIFMRQTPNLEGAVQFASDNLTSYLALDLKKLIWDTAARKYNNIKEALDEYSKKMGEIKPGIHRCTFSHRKLNFAGNGRSKTWIIR